MSCPRCGSIHGHLDFCHRIREANGESPSRGPKLSPYGLDHTETDRELLPQIKKGLRELWEEVRDIKEELKGTKKR